MIKDKDILLESEFGVKLYLVKRFKDNTYKSKFYRIKYIEDFKCVSKIYKTKLEATTKYKLIKQTKSTVDFKYTKIIKSKIKSLIDYRLNAVNTISLESYNIVKDCLILAKEIELEVKYINKLKAQFNHFKFEEYD